jgi:hypothetical protein
MRAAADVARDRALRELAGRLREQLPRVPSSYRAGRAALIDALADLEDLPIGEATERLTELEELGAVKYTTEGRGIGAAGVWTYPRTSTARPRTRTRTRTPARACRRRESR